MPTSGAHKQTSVKQLPDGLELLNITKHQNRHANFKQKLKKNASFKLRIPSGSKSIEKYNKTTKNFQWLIKHAIENDLRLRAMGSGWSFTKCCVASGGIIDTKSLRLSFSLSKSDVETTYTDNGGEASNLFFAQCGMAIIHINKKLEHEKSPKKCLKASGASNGQTIAGALSTGTHGAALEVGALQECVVGLHLVVGPDRHVYLERKTNPVVSQKFVNAIGAELIRDDSLFNSAVVSFGSFGFIHGVMLETESIFLLEKHIKEVPYNEPLKRAMNTLDFSSIESAFPFPIKGDKKDLYHFEVAVNPHSFRENDSSKPVFMKTIYKMPFDPNVERKQRNAKGFTYGDETLGVIQTILDALGPLSRAIIPKLVNSLFPMAYNHKKVSVGTIGETFHNTNLRGEAASMAMAVDVKHTTQVLAEIIKLNKKTKFPGGVGIRYLKGTKATLGFTKFPKTAVIELDGVDSKATRKFYKKIWARLESLDINYTLHWGKMNFNINGQLVRKMYGTAKVSEWIGNRKRLLDSKSRKVFVNKFLERCGLVDDVV